VILTENSYSSIIAHIAAIVASTWGKKDSKLAIFPPSALDVDGNGYISASELGDLFSEVGSPMPGYQVRLLLAKLDRDNDSHIDIEEFKAVGNTN